MTPRIVTAPRVKPVMQVAAGDADVETGQALYDDAHYDTLPEATSSGYDALWTDDTCDVIEAVTFYGRQRGSNAFDIGTATLRIQNPDGLWDYPPTSDLTPLSVRPGRMIRVGVIVDGEPPDWLWTGWIDATEPAYDPALGVDVVAVSAICAKGQAARAEAPSVTTPVGANEDVTARMTRYADIALFPTHRRQFEVSGIDLAGTTLGGRVGLLMDRSAASAAGDIYGDESGNLIYRNMDWETSSNQADGTIGNRGLPGEVCPNLWETTFKRSDFASRVHYGRSGESAYTINDLANQDKYGIETFVKNNLETVDTEIIHMIGTRLLRTRNFDLAPLISACVLDAARPGVVDLLRGASPFLPSVYQCGHVTDDGRTVFARQSILTGIEHTINAGSWIAKLSLDDAAPYTEASNAVYDDAYYNTDRYARTG